MFVYANEYILRKKQVHIYESQETLCVNLKWIYALGANEINTTVRTLMPPHCTLERLHLVM